MRLVYLKERALLLSSILLTLFIFAGIGVISHDALTVRNAEDTEEDVSQFLLHTERWLNHQQQIEIAARDFVISGDASNLDVIAQNRHDAVEHETGMLDILREHHRQDAEARVRELTALAARHQQTIDRVVTLRRSSDPTGAQRVLAATDSRSFIADAGRIIEQLSDDLQTERTRANSKVSLNALRGSVSFGLMAVLMTSIVWTGYGLTRRTQRRNAELSDQLLLRATHDALTQLPNRDLFYDRLSRAIALARRKRTQLAVLYLDLDGFKVINDSYGHQIGDATLKEAARRLLECIREADTVARLGGDEFAIVLQDINSADDAAFVAQKIIHRMIEPMTLYGGGTYRIGTSVGIAIYPDCGVEIDRLVKAADHAMYQSKTAGKNCYTLAPFSGPGHPSDGGWINFVDDFKVGVSVIDEQHETLAVMLNRLNAELARQMPTAQLEALLDDFIAFSAVHFETEERLMRQYHYAEAVAHEDEHQRLLREFRYLQARFSKGGELLVLQWLKDWLVGHVAGSDRRLSEYLLQSGVE